MTPMTCRSLALILPLVGLLGACQHAFPHVVKVLRTAPEKDVLHCRIELSQPVLPLQYRAWSRADLRQHRSLLDEPAGAVPVYEVHYTFHDAHARLATVSFRRNEDGAGNLRHLRTVVFPEAVFPEAVFPEEPAP